MKKIIIIGLLIIVIIIVILCGRERKIKVLLAGDALVIEKTLEDAYNKDTGTYDFKPMFKYVKDYIKDYDIKFYNQETSISGDQFEYLGFDCYNTPSQFGLDMIDAGFNMVSLANNHTFDGELGVVNGRIYCYKSELGVSNSLKFWNNKEDIYVSGSYESQKMRDKVVIKKKNGISYTLLSYTYGLNIFDTYNDNPYMVNIYSEEQVKKDVEKVRDKVDVIFVSMHWGYENEESLIPNEKQKQQANYLASLGVDVVIGHHPYVIQPVEKIGNTWVFYSLGRIISSLPIKNDNYDKLVGLLGELTIVKKGGKVSIQNTNNELIYNYYDENRDNNVIVPFSLMNTDFNINYIDLYEKYQKIVKLYNNNIKLNLID